MMDKWKRDEYGPIRVRILLRHGKMGVLNFECYPDDDDDRNVGFESSLQWVQLWPKSKSSLPPALPLPIQETIKAFLSKVTPQLRR
jgi:hypothetical protein